MNNYIKKAQYNDILATLRARGIRKQAAGNWEVTPEIRQGVNQFKQVPGMVRRGLNNVDKAEAMVERVTGAPAPQHTVHKPSAAQKTTLVQHTKPENQGVVDSIDTARRVTGSMRAVANTARNMQNAGQKLMSIAPVGDNVRGFTNNSLQAANTGAQVVGQVGKYIDKSMDATGMNILRGASTGRYNPEAQNVGTPQNLDGDFKFNLPFNLPTTSNETYAKVKGLTNLTGDVARTVGSAVELGSDMAVGAQKMQQWLSNNPQAKAMAEQAISNINNNPALNGVKKTLGATGGVLSAVSDLNELAHDPSFMNLVDATGSVSNALQLCGVTAAGPVAAAVGTFTTSKALTEALVNHYGGVEEGNKFVDNYAENNLKGEDGYYRKPTAGETAYMVGGHMANQAGAVANGAANDAAYFWNIDKNILSAQARRQIEANEAKYRKGHPRAPEYFSGQREYMNAVNRGEKIDPKNPKYSYFFNQQSDEWGRAALGLPTQEEENDMNAVSNGLAENKRQQEAIDKSMAPVDIPATTNGDIDQNRVINNATWAYNAPKEDNSPFEKETDLDRAEMGMSLEEREALAKEDEARARQQALAKRSSYVLAKSLLNKALYKKF